MKSATIAVGSAWSQVYDNIEDMWNADRLMVAYGQHVPKMSARFTDMVITIIRIVIRSGIRDLVPSSSSRYLNINGDAHFLARSWRTCGTLSPVLMGFFFKHHRKT